MSHRDIWIIEWLVNVQQLPKQFDRWKPEWVPAIRAMVYEDHGEAIKALKEFDKQHRREIPTRIARYARKLGAEGR